MLCLLAEREHKACFYIGRSQVIYKLAFMLADHLTGNFQFQKNQLVDKQICPKVSYDFASKHYADGRLLDDFKPGLTHRQRHSARIHAFNKGDAQLILNGIEDPNHLLRQRSVRPQALIHSDPSLSVIFRSIRVIFIFIAARA